MNRVWSFIKAAKVIEEKSHNKRRKILGDSLRRIRPVRSTVAKKRDLYRKDLTDLVYWRKPRREEYDLPNMLGYSMRLKER